METTLDPKKIYFFLKWVIVWPGQLISPFHSRFFKVDRTLSNLFKKMLSQGWDEPCHQAFGKLRASCLHRPCSSSWSWQPCEVHMGRVTLSLADCCCKIDGHCIWEHEARCLSKEMANSWEITLCHSALFEDVVTIIGVAQRKGLHA